ncbi:MAG: helix-turn-helix transcriptional regulator [Thermoplasmata archaeon]|nr:helix-turn-helix transcriptional regulator [Thermoplasmata archaeon]MBE3139638.1 helix-turn-helix transcriptional regulator [Thermoplasmata archaeon]
MELIGSTKKRILLEIAKRPSHGYQLALSLTLPLSTVYGHLSDLHKLGLIEKKIRNRQIIYDLTEKGKTFIKMIQ